MPIERDRNASNGSGQAEGSKRGGFDTASLPVWPPP